MTASSVAIPVPAARTARPGLCALAMLASDLSAVGIAMVSAVLVRHVLDGKYDLSLYASLAPALLVFPLGYALLGLYSGAAYSAVRELRRLTLGTTLVFVLFATLLFLFKEAATYSRLVFLFGWVLCLALVPLMRTALRRSFASKPWWGYPVAIFGSRELVTPIVDGLLAQPESGLHPVAVFEDSETLDNDIRGVPVLGNFQTAPFYAARLNLAHAIVAKPDALGTGVIGILETHANLFSHVYVMPGLDGFSSLGIEARDICNVVALQVRRSLLLPECQLAKRAIDIGLATLLLVVLAPLLVLIALLIRLESPGHVLFGHRRIGHGGRKFKMWKFRSMYSNGAEILERYFEQHPAERVYYQRNMKLPNDPRVTPLGRILRRTSLDEFPQLWNVLRGEMSLVGPRPIVDSEVEKYGSHFELYCRVVPGLTGLWQVSGRSTTDYDRRVELDSYYVRNWSPWLDIYLLSRTFKAVLRAEGAY